jgi:type I restriction enzyme, S subunit
MSWECVKLETLAADIPYSFVGGPFGSRLTSRDYASEGIPVIRGSNLKERKYLDTKQFVYVSDSKVKEELFGNIAYPLDLVFTQRGTLGQVAIIPRDGPSERYVISQSQMKMTVDETKADRHFIYYYFSAPGTIQRIINLISSSGVPHINLTILRNFVIPTPPLPIQKKIASFLSAYDDLIENNRRRIQLLEQAARLLYKEWFVHLRFPGHEHTKIKDGVPEGWVRKKISEVGETIGGGTPSTKNSEYWDGDITWMVPSDITRNDCLFLLESERKITQKGLRESSARMVPAKSILMTSRASVGFFALVDHEVCTNQGFINIIPYDDRMKNYILFNLISRVEEIRRNAKGTTYPEISKGRFREMDIIIPNIFLINGFEKIVGEVIQQIITLKKQALQLTKARDLLLPRLMNGEIAV